MTDSLTRRAARRLRRAVTPDAPAAPKPPARRGPVEVARAATAGVRLDAEAPSVVLVLPGVQPGQMFAGIRTALLAGATTAERLGRPYRVVLADTATVDGAAIEADVHAVLRETGRTELAQRTAVCTPGHGELSHHADDVWIATYWTTALAIDALVRDERVQRDHVIYLVQDYEPGFYAWGHHFAQASSTYRLGFVPVVNSASLAAHLRHEEVPDVDDARVFAPEVEVAPLVTAAARWTPEQNHLRVLFYARPSKPRNMYALGVAALRVWSAGLPAGTRATVTFAGEPIPTPPDLGDGVSVRILGKTSFDEYFDELSRTDVGLALMLSPHPSHLALELPMSGIPTVTNRFLGVREAWVPGLHLAEADPDSLAEALAAAVAEAEALTSHDTHALPATLGGTLEAAVASAVSCLGVRY